MIAELEQLERLYEAEKKQLKQQVAWSLCFEAFSLILFRLAPNNSMKCVLLFLWSGCYCGVELVCGRLVHVIARRLQLSLSIKAMLG